MGPRDPGNPTAGATGRETLHGGDPFGNGPISNLARLYIRLELARATRALVLSIPDPLTLRRAVIRRVIATSPTRMSTCANVHNMGRSKCCEC